MQELYHRYRPQKWEDVVGQPAAVRVLTSFAGEYPHFLLLSGPSGVGKTTLARIIKGELGCSDHDFTEVDGGQFRGIDNIRDLRKKVSIAPAKGKCRMWLLDEVHKCTGDSQSAMLKMLEDTPSHVYFVACTTHPQKLLPTLHSRATEVKFKPVPDKDLELLLKKVIKAEKARVTDDVVDKIVEVADGSPRKALVILEQVYRLKEEAEQLSAIARGDYRAEAVRVAQALLNPQTKWPDMAKILEVVEEDAESLRHLVLAYTSKVMLKGGRNLGRCYLILQAFRDNFYDSGKAGLLIACYDVITNK